MKHQFLPGDSQLTETLIVPFGAGGEVAGCGGADFVVNSSHKNDEDHSRVKVAVEPGVWLQGSGQEVHHTCFVDDGQKRTGILLSRPPKKSGLNAHRANVHDCHFEGLGVGFALGKGESYKESGCDSCSGDRITAAHCDAVIRINTEQAMANEFTGIDTVHCGVVMDNVAGGCNTLRRASITNVPEGQRAAFIRTGPGRGISHNNGQISLIDAKSDNHAAGRVVLIEMTDYAICTFHVERGIASDHTVAAEHPQFLMMGGGKLRITGRKVFANSILVLGNKLLIIELESCDLISDDDDLRSIIRAESTAPIKIVPNRVSVPAVSRQIEVVSGGVYTR